MKSWKKAISRAKYNRVLDNKETKCLSGTGLVAPCLDRYRLREDCVPIKYKLLLDGFAYEKVCKIEGKGPYYFRFAVQKRECYTPNFYYGREEE
jgi:hypothetical protein